MNHIPKSLNDELNKDKFYLKCCLARFGGCGGRIQRHHALKYAGSQLQKKFCILPACEGHHDQARNKDIKEKFDWVLLNRATDQELKDISKSTDYIWERNRLNKIYSICQ